MPRKKVVSNNTPEKLPRRRGKKEKCTTKHDETKDQGNNHTDEVNKEKMISLVKRQNEVILANEVARHHLPLIRTFEEGLNKNKSTNGNMKSNPIIRRKRPNLLINNASDEQPTRKRRKIIPNKLKIGLRTSDIAEPTANVTETQVDQNKKQPLRRVRKGGTIKAQTQAQEPVENKPAEAIKSAKSKIIRGVKPAAYQKTYTGPRTRKKRLTEETAPTEEITKQTDIIVDNSINNSTDNTDLFVKNSGTDVLEDNEVNIDIANVLDEKFIEKEKGRESVTSELSWTKDISSGSSINFGTVSAKDFVRIDKKLPLIKLSDINKDNNKTTHAVEATVVEMNNNFPNQTKTCDNLIDDAELDLSSSSTSSSESETSKTSDKLSNILDKLASKLTNFDLEIVNWIGYKSPPSKEVRKIQDKLFQPHFLKEEMNILQNCQSIKNILSKQINVEETDLRNFENPTNEKTVNDNAYMSNNVNDQINKDSNKVFPEPSIDKYRENTHNKPIENSISHHRTCDEDDDALSLFAESISGIETTARHNKGNDKSKFEEYIPETIVKSPIIHKQNISYNRTNIIKTTELGEAEKSQAIVCEKQNADSTSVFKDNEDFTSDNFFEDRLHDMNKEQNDAKLTTMNKTSGGFKSLIFNQICYHNLVAVCYRGDSCKYNHVSVTPDDVRRKLENLTNEIVFKEYNFFRYRPKYKVKYGMCFLEECIKRDLLRDVVEITLDFAINMPNSVVNLEIMETALLYLNGVDLCLCTDLLGQKVTPNMLLCDYFLGVIAMSQNFSRFKSVFVNLTNFIFAMGGQFSCDVALHILERVLILPYEENLMQALMKIIKNTDNRIFSSSMIGHLEKQLLFSNKGIYEELRMLKEIKLGSPAGGNSFNNSFNSDLDGKNVGHLDKNIRHSPDTTNLDTLAKTPTEPIFTRTIDLNKLKFIKPYSTSSVRNDRNQRKGPTNITRRGRFNGSLSNVLMRPPLRPAFKRRSDSHKFQRRNGPNCFM